MFAQLRPMTKAVATIALICAASSAQAESYDIKLQAFVPTSCSADFSEGFTPVNANSFALGHVNQFCNTRFQLTLNHGAVAPSGFATLGGAVVNLTGAQSDLKALANPVANASEELVIHGFDQAQAEEFRSVLVVTVSPVAF
jgi:hypothetical protein